MEQRGGFELWLKVRAAHGLSNPQLDRPNQPIQNCGSIELIFDRAVHNRLSQSLSLKNLKST